MKNELGFDFDFDLKNFNTEGVDITKTFKTRYIKPAYNILHQESCAAYEYAEDLANDIKITDGCRYYIIVNGSFYAGDFIEALIVKNNWKVKKMTIASLSINENNVDSLKNLFVWGMLDQLDLILSDLFYSNQRINMIPYILEELDVDNKFQLAITFNHCKIFQFETHCGKKIVIHGSANLPSSHNIEQINVEENAAIYDFNAAWLDPLGQDYRMINKSISRKNLWERIKKERAPRKKRKPKPTK